ncbi:penicillin-binding protein [Kitasatospora sp. NBC_01250]|uniref:transglycosylase domain-containing protein n=1 Tax=unclassified Kitasatospora TaxID=2633591 RepID=UPI002E109639|nr:MULTISPECIES: transglycosylase domain-containing protein [unclassified Kitasatospora]WSJ68319.1 penicillin-binding protein [Kitasatospora sp. NBC_01302]
MSEHRRRSANSGGDEQPPGRPNDQRPYAYGSAPEGAPSYDTPGRPRAARPAGPRGPQAMRETAQQPRMTRAEMRKAAQKGGGGRKGGGPGGGGGRDGRGAGAKPPGKKRFIDYPRWGKSGVRRWLPSWKQLLSVFLIFFGGGVAAVGTAYAMTTVPALKDMVNNAPNTYYWADGSEMTSTGSLTRQVVPIGDINKSMQDAVIAAENESFRTDPGIDPKGIARAMYNMASGQATQGGSTITQQYVKNAYLSQSQTLSRKLKEFFITLKINQKMSKDDILDGYLNTSWFGRQSYGIQAAAHNYYNVDAKDLNVCQSAMLAGLLKGAGLYDPSLSASNHANMFGTPAKPDTGRWEWILGKMVETKAITKDQQSQCLSAGLPEPVKQQTATNMTGQVGYIVATVNKYLEQKDPTITDASLGRGGYKIYTTLQKDKVDELSAAVAQMQQQNLDPVKHPTTDTNVQVGAASVIPGDGALVALYGGPGQDKGQYSNNADTTGVPVGSTFKPYVLATAMQVGLQTQTGPDGKPLRINEDSRYNADDLSTIRQPDGSLVKNQDGSVFHQKNDEDGPQGYVTLRDAMINSFNVPYVQLGEDVGGSNVAKLAEQMGLSAASMPVQNQGTAAFAIGTSTPSAIQMASGYSVFAARGQQADMYPVTKVQLGDRTLSTFTKPTPKTVLDQAVADNITSVLQDVVAKGTGKKALAVGRPVAGKTGTTDKGTSAWFDGYTPQLATAITMFREDPNHPGLQSLVGTGGRTEFAGGDLPTEIFANYMKAALANTPVADFPDPAAVNQEVDASGAPSTASPSPSTSASSSPSSTPSSTPSAPASSQAPPPSPTTQAPPQPPTGGGPETCLPGVDCGGQPTASKQPPGGGNGGGTGGGGTGGGGNTGAPGGGGSTCAFGDLFCGGGGQTSAPPTTKPTHSGGGGAGGATGGPSSPASGTANPGAAGG